jgi:hypothetical protein
MLNQLQKADAMTMKRAWLFLPDRMVRAGNSHHHTRCGL